MNLLKIFIFISSQSFMGYEIAYFKSTKMNSECKRFKPLKAEVLTAILKILGAVGLLIV